MLKRFLNRLRQSLSNRSSTQEADDYCDTQCIGSGQLPGLEPTRTDNNLQIDSNLIIDVGMNDGRDTELYLMKGFRVISIEANPALVAAAKEKFDRELRDGRLEIIQKAINKEDGISKFVVNNFDHWSSLIEHIGTRDNTEYSVIDVPCITFDKILSQVDMPYYLKIDIEGADAYVLEALGKFSERPKYISVEASSLDYFCLLRSLGYSKYKLINQLLHSETKAPFPALEGDYVDMKFDHLCSGLFGEETAGEWLSIEQVTYEWLHNHMGYPERSNIGEGWCDIHAKL